MTKEIIIDGVDVAGCANLDSLICNCGVICKGRNCYYKQLKRLEQENFELKESLKCFQTPEAIKALTFYKTGEFELQEKKCIKLEQENNLLKQTLKDKNFVAIVEENKKLLQTLQEIKEIAECEIKELTDSAINGGRYLEILAIITKAEEE